MDLPSDGAFLATHVQIDEINNTKDSERRARLFLKFAEVRPEIVPTESFALDVSRLDYGKLSDGERLIESQFLHLQEPEPAITIPADWPPDQIVNAIQSRLEI